MTLLINEELVAEALERLPHEHRGKANIEAFLTTFVSQVQDIENVLWELFTERDIDSAVGVQLDMLGTIVGQPRSGVTDDDIYRRYVRARISVNRSKGTVEDIYTVAVAVLDDESAALSFEFEGPASGVFYVRDVTTEDAVAQVLIDFLRETVAGGVRIISVTQVALDSDTFRFAALATLDAAHGSGAGTLDTLGIPSNFPSTGGTLILDAALAVEESIDYTSHDGTTFTLSGTTANAHGDGSGITLDDGEGKGWSDDVSTSLGGKFVTAKE